MPVDVEKLLQRVEALEQDVKELYRMILDLREGEGGGKNVGIQAQTTTVNWWQTWVREEEQ